MAVFSPSLKICISRSVIRAVFPSPASGKQRSVSMLVRRSRCLSLTRTGRHADRSLRGHTCSRRSALDHRRHLVSGRTEFTARLPIPQNPACDDRRLARALRTGRLPLLHRQPARIHETQSGSVDGDDWTETRNRRPSPPPPLPTPAWPSPSTPGTLTTSTPKISTGRDRLALCALAKYYGKNVVYSGPWSNPWNASPVPFDFTSRTVTRSRYKRRQARGILDRRRRSQVGLGRRRIEGDTVVVSSSFVPNLRSPLRMQSNPAATLSTARACPQPFPHRYLAGKTEGHRSY